MIPATIQDHLRQHHMGWEHHHHHTATSAQALAHAEHVSGYHVAKPVAVKVGGKRAIAVVSAAQRVRLGVLEEATGCDVELVPEFEMWNWFVPCDVGTEPPLSIQRPHLRGRRAPEGEAARHAGRHLPGCDRGRHERVGPLRARPGDPEPGVGTLIGAAPARLRRARAHGATPRPRTSTRSAPS